MTSLSVRGYTTGIYRQLGLKEEEVTKVQTGGPDGDLGSSEFFGFRSRSASPLSAVLTLAATLIDEILLSKDKTIAYVHSSHFLCHLC